MAAMDYHGKDENTLVEVLSEKSAIDPRRCGNVARYVNHCFRPNALLQEVGISGGHRVVMLQALEDIPPGKEIVIDYAWYSTHTPWPFRCFCKHPKCRGHI